MTPTIQEYVTAVLPAKDELKVGLNPLALPHLGPRPLQWHLAGSSAAQWCHCDVTVEG